MLIEKYLDILVLTKCEFNDSLREMQKMAFTTRPCLHLAIQMLHPHGAICKSGRIQKEETTCH